MYPVAASFFSSKDETKHFWEKVLFLSIGKTFITVYLDII